MTTSTQTQTHQHISGSSVPKDQTGPEWVDVKNVTYVKEILRAAYTFNSNLPLEGDVQIIKTKDGLITLFNHLDYPHVIRVEDLGARWRITYADIPGRPLVINKKLALEMSEEDLEDLRTKHQIPNTLAN